MKRRKGFKCFFENDYGGTNLEKKQRYTIKKLSIGVVSVLAGTTLYLSGSTSASADEVKPATNASQPTMQLGTETEAKNDTDKTVPPQVPTPSQASEKTVVEPRSEEDTTVKNRTPNGDFEGQEIANKAKWSTKPWGNSEIITEKDNTYGKIAGETTDEYVLQKVQTTPGRTYDVSADINVLIRGVDHPAGAKFVAGEYVDGKLGKIYQQVALDQVSSGKQTFEFTAQSDDTLVGIVKQNVSGQELNVKKTEVSIDNLVVSEKANSEYTTIWQEDFTDSELDSKTWTFMPGPVNRSEQQNYTTSKENVALEDGELVFKPTKRPEIEKNPVRPAGRPIKYDSGFINTFGKKEFLYGKIEMRAKLPKGQGAFPAFWLMGTSNGWPGGGEIDIMELIGAPTEERLAQGEKDPTDNGRQSNKIIYGTPHFWYEKGDVDKDGSYDPFELGGNVRITDDFCDDYHVFGIDWSPDRIDWYLDGVVYNSMSLSGNERLEAAARSLNRPQIIKLNLATGGDWAGDAGDHLAEDGTQMRVDWIKWSQNDEQKAAAAAWYADAPKITGIKDLTMTEGEQLDVLKGVGVTGGNYQVSASLDDEYMYRNGDLKNINKFGTDQIAQLNPGVYNIHYSAGPVGVTLDGANAGKYKSALQTVLLTVLPKEGLTGTAGEKLASVKLPKGWQWQDDQQLVESGQTYPIYFGAEDNARRILTHVTLNVDEAAKKEDPTAPKDEKISGASAVENVEPENPSVSATSKANDDLLKSQITSAENPKSTVEQSSEQTHSTKQELPKMGEKGSFMTLLLGLISFLGGLFGVKIFKN